MIHWVIKQLEGTEEEVPLRFVKALQVKEVGNIFTSITNNNT